LNRIGYAGKVLRKNASGKTRTLSFRDLARLCVVTEEGIQRRGSPILSGQFVTATSDYAAFKLMITGNDDSAFVQSIADSSGSEREDGKIELLDQMIAELQAELDETGVDERELRDQEERLNTSLQNQVTLLQSAQLKFNELISDRSELAISLRGHKSRLIEISELINRFYLLDRHYDTDVQRLHAIRESGTLFVNFSAKACPLCGAKPADQHLNSECDGNAEAVVKAAEAEILKIEQLRRELEETITSLRAEFVDIEFMMPLIQARYDDIELQLTQFVAPNLTGERASYNELMNQMTNVRFSSEKIIRLKGLIERRTNLELTGDGVFIAKEKTATRVSKSILDEFAQEVQDILQKWDYPYASRVFFDESTKDIQISGKDRGSTGKGLRAITHAAFTIGLMQFCKERDMPHPGFVVLDSPLLAYWKPEGDDDDLRGTSLKESFYKYLLSISKDQQVIIIENEHPPDFVEKGANVAVFTKNPSVGRYGFFPFP
jgi:chromosome segregation ATPase